MNNRATCLFTNVHVCSPQVPTELSRCTDIYICVCVSVCNAVSRTREHRREGTKGNPMLYSRVYTL